MSAGLLSGSLSLCILVLGDHLIKKFSISFAMDDT